MHRLRDLSTDLLDQLSLDIIQEEGTGHHLDLLLTTTVGHLNDLQATGLHTRIHHTLPDSHLLQQGRNSCSNETTEMLGLIEAPWQRHQIMRPFNDHEHPPTFIIRSNCNLPPTFQQAFLHLLSTLLMPRIQMEDSILILLHKDLDHRLSVHRRMVLHTR